MQRTAPSAAVARTSKSPVCFMIFDSNTLLLYNSFLRFFVRCREKDICALSISAVGRVVCYEGYFQELEVVSHDTLLIVIVAKPATIYWDIGVDSKSPRDYTALA
jgi:hypothetical protein